MPRTKKIESKRKKGRPRKNKTITQNQNWEEDFVFPVFENSLKHENISARGGSPPDGRAGALGEKTLKQKNKLSSHILDLRQPIKPEPSFEKPSMPPVFNSDNWFSNFNLPELAHKTPKKEIDFELPEYTETPAEKIKFHKPVKHKAKSQVKLNFGQDIIKKDKLAVKTKTKIPLQKFVVWLKVEKIFRVVWSIITFPFKALDFMVDRTLKIIWWLIKFTTLTLVNLIKSIFLNLKTILVTPKVARVEVTSISALKERKINYKPVLSFALVCLIIVLPLQILNLKQKSLNIKGRVLGRSIEGFEALKNASLLGKNFDFQGASQKFKQAYFNFQLAHNYLNNLDILSQQLIKIVPEANQADNLLMVGQLASELGQELIHLIQKLQAIEQEDDSEVKIIKKVEVTALTLNQIEPYFLELLERVKNIEIKTLTKYVDEKDLEKLILFQSSLSTLKQNFDQLKTLNQFLADFLGQEKTQKYLVIFQNNSELRPTGGFMGSYALVEIKNGEIIHLEVPGGGFYDLKAGNQITVEAPKPFHLFSPVWQIWNANWFPDWPVSAEKIVWFYEQSLTGVTVDGVIALTPDVIEDLLEITGPLEMPDYEKTITKENFVREVQMVTEVEYDKEENQPKKIIADLIPKILAAVFNLKIEQIPAFLELLSRNLAKKNILGWFKDEKMQEVVQNFSWAGEIKSSQSDYLMVVHTNIGGGKTDRVIKNKISHLAEVDQEWQVINTVTLTRIHQGRAGDIFEEQNNVDYVRFYVPQGSQLVSAQGFDYIPSNLFKVAANQKELTPDPDLERLEKNPILDERFNMRITEEFGKTVFGNWLLVKPGEEKIVTIKYKLPLKLQKSSENLLTKLINFIKPTNQETIHYYLIIQKQPGVESTDLISQLNLPSDWQVIATQAKKNNAEYSREKNIIIYHDDLKTDGYYGVEIK